MIEARRLPGRVLRTGCAIIAASMVLSAARAALLDPEAYPPPGQYVWVGQHRLHVHCMGKGTPTVVFDSGLGGTTLVWTRVQREVAKFTRACTYDRAGYGWSGRGPLPRTSAIIVSELERLLGYGGVMPPYVMVGHSFGGFNVRLFANAHPTRVAGLVLVDSSHEEQFRRIDDANLGAVAPRSGRFVIANHYQIPDGLPEELRELAQDFALAPDSIASLYSELRYFRISAEQVRAASTLPDVPLVVISRDVREASTSGRHQQMAELWFDMQEDLAGLTSQGRLVVAETREHYVQLHEPRVVVDAIRSVVYTSRLTTCPTELEPLTC